MSKKNIGILFSGGGTKIAGHAGYALALEEEGMIFEMVAGVSAGAIIAPFVAAGVVSQKAEAFKNIQPKDFWKRAPLTKKGGLRFYAIMNIIRGRNYLGDMSKLKQELFKSIYATDFFVEAGRMSVYQAIKRTGVSVYAEKVNIKSGAIELGAINRAGHTDMPMDDFISASSSIPVFSEIIKSGADGGLRNHLPIKSLKDYCYKRLDIVVAVYSRPEILDSVLDGLPEPKNILDMLMRSIAIMNFEISKNDQSELRAYCKKMGIELIELFQPAGFMEGVYDTDLKHQENLFHYCYNTGQVIARKTKKLWE